MCIKSTSRVKKDNISFFVQDFLWYPYYFNGRPSKIRLNYNMHEVDKFLLAI